MRKSRAVEAVQFKRVRYCESLCELYSLLMPTFCKTITRDDISVLI